MFPVGISTHGIRRVTEDWFIGCQRSGVGRMELSIAGDACLEQDYGQIGRWAKEYGVELWSYHLPYVPWQIIGVSDPEKVPRTLEIYRELIGRATDVGVTRFVVHPGDGPNEEGPRRQANLDCAKDALSRLADIAAPYGGVIAVENLPRNCLGRTSAEMLEILDTNEKLRSCFDTNHLLIEDPVHYVKAVGSRIITTHVSDYDFVDEKHWWPGEGKLNYTAVLNALREVGFAGTWMYEVNLTIGDRTELCAAVLDNAMRAFRGEFGGSEKIPQE